MQRYFVKKEQIINDICFISGLDFHHIKNVMRLKIGNKVYLCDEEKTYLGKIESFSDKEVLIKIWETLNENSEMGINITIAHGLVRREKQEEVMRRIVELGAYSYIPVNMDRSIIKVKEKENKKERYNLIVKEASEQCHRQKIMLVKDITTIKELIKTKNEYDLCLFAFEDDGREKNTILKNLLENFKGKSILALFGPEGGFSESEVKLLKENGFISIGLGPRIMRTETAPLYFMASCSYQFEFGEKNEN